jgi:hypothetical protein
MAARARTTYVVGTNIQATTVTKAAQLAWISTERN